MKKSKIFGICSVLAVLLTACKPGGTTSNSSSGEGPDFTYSKPSTSIQEDYVIAIDYKGNDTLKNKVAEVIADNSKVDELLPLISSNPLLPTKGEVNIENIVAYDKNKDGNLDNDLGNLNIKENYKFTRDNANHSKSGTFTYASKTIEKESDKADAPVVVKEKSVTDGVYALSVDTHNYEIVETFDYHDDGLNKTNNYFLNETNLRKNMQVVNLDNYQEKLNEAYKSWSKLGEDIYKRTLTVGEDSLTLKMNKTFILETVEVAEEYAIDITKAGYVKSCSYLNTMKSETTTAGTYDKILEKHASNYTFSL